MFCGKRSFKTHLLLSFLPLGAIMLASGCGSVGDKNIPARGAALPVMENIALNARNCWFKSGDKNFSAYRLAPELTSYSDKPRILLVPYAAPAERPLLVIEASGNPARISAYGPLMQTPLGRKIDKNLRNWAQAGKKC